MTDRKEGTRNKKNNTASGLFSSSKREKDENKTFCKKLFQDSTDGGGQRSGVGLGPEVLTAASILLTFTHKFHYEMIASHVFLSQSVSEVCLQQRCGLIESHLFCGLCQRYVFSRAVACQQPSESDTRS